MRGDSFKPTAGLPLGADGKPVKLQQLSSLPPGVGVIPGGRPPAPVQALGPGVRRYPPAPSPFPPGMQQVLRRANPANLDAAAPRPIFRGQNMHLMRRKVDPYTMDEMDLSTPHRSRPPIFPQYLSVQPRSVHFSEYEGADHEELEGGVQPTQHGEPKSAQDDSYVEYTTNGGDKAQQLPDEYSNTTQLGPFDAELVQNLLRRLEELEIENAQLQEDQRLKAKEPEVTQQVFHTVARNSDDDGSDDGSSESSDELNMAGDGSDTFLSEPRWDVRDGKAQLRGLFHVPDPDGYVERKGNVSFVVYKCYDIAHQRKEVDEAIRSNKAMPEPTPERQEFLLISEEMIQAVKEFFDQDPAFRTEFPHLNERKRMRPPFIWWYHYKKTLDTSRLQPRQSQLVSAFTDAIDDSYGSLYNKIDDQFSRGLVSPASMQYLIRPGSVLISKDGDTPRGHLAQGHPLKQPNLTDDEKKNNEKYRSAWDIPTTTIMYKGELFWAEMNIPLVLKAESDHTEIAIKSLSVMPIEYASSELQQQLENRGKHMFWRRRHGNLVSYEESSGKNKSIVRIIAKDYQTPHDTFHIQSYAN